MDGIADLSFSTGVMKYHVIEIQLLNMVWPTCRLKVIFFIKKYKNYLKQIDNKFITVSSFS